jgi:pyruvate/2-oxoglutarate dehydrogenase complex dihydrolipoamide acyltransferase (E2) component
MRFRDILGLTLSADHRAVDGAYGARFLAALVATLQEFKFDD